MTQVAGLTAARLVMFDFDGTLSDTIPGITGTARTVLLAHGMRHDELGDLRRLVGPPFPYAFELVYGLSHDEAVAVTADYRELYGRLGPAGWPLFEGMREVLEDLRSAGRLVAIVSSKRDNLIRAAVADNRLEGCLDGWFGKENDETDTKEATIARTLARFGVAPEDAVMVGDRRFDVEAAHANGVPCVGAHWIDTCPESELVEAGADAVAHTLGDLRRILLGRQG